MDLSTVHPVFVTLVLNHVTFPQADQFCNYWNRAITHVMCKFHKNLMSSMTNDEWTATAILKRTSDLLSA